MKKTLSILILVLALFILLPSRVLADPTKTCASQDGHCVFSDTCANGPPITSSDCKVIGFKCCPDKLSPTPTPNPPTGTTTWYNSSFKDWFTKVYDPENPNEIFGERYTAAQVQWVIYGLWGFLINNVTGPTNAPIVQCFISDFQNIGTCGDAFLKLLASPPGQSSLAATNDKSQNLWGLVFANRPLSGISYIKEKVHKFSLAPTAQAQTIGFGYKALEPIRGMWKAFRDFSFGLFIIAAVVFAFMIMFRIKLSPQTVISVQSALPKLVISLILVTFSYAIAGFLVDLMYVVIGIFSYLGSQLILNALPYLGFKSPLDIFNLLTLGQPLGWNIQIGVIGIMVIYLISFAIALIILLVLNVGAIGTVVGTALVVLLAAPFIELLLTISLILFILVAVILVWHFIKITWMLLKAFANVLLLTIFAPLQITAGILIPNFGFGPWVKSYLSALSTFVVTGVLVLFMFVFLSYGVLIGMEGLGNGLGEAFLKALFGQNLSNFVHPESLGFPPLLPSGSEAGMGLLFLGVSFVLFTMIPKAAELVQSFTQGKPFAYGSAIGEAVVSPIAGLVKTGVFVAKTAGDIKLRGKDTSKKAPEPPSTQA